MSSQKQILESVNNYIIKGSDNDYYFNNMVNNAPKAKLTKEESAIKKIEHENEIIKKELKAYKAHIKKIVDLFNATEDKRYIDIFVDAVSGTFNDIEDKMSRLNTDYDRELSYNVVEYQMRKYIYKIIKTSSFYGLNGIY